MSKEKIEWKQFSCGCRDWFFNYELDSKKETGKETHIVHDCPKLKVCREKRSIRRTFIWKKSFDNKGNVS